MYPCRQFDDMGMVNLTNSKVEKVIQIHQNIECLLWKTKPSLDHTLLSLTIHRKTGSRDAIGTYHKLDYRISYIETSIVDK